MKGENPIMGSFRKSKSDTGNTSFFPTPVYHSFSKITYNTLKNIEIKKHTYICYFLISQI